jgi:hypothetical protein
MFKQTLIFSSLLASCIVLSEINNDSNSIESNSNTQSQEQSNSPDKFLEQHLHSLDSQIGILWGAGITSGTIAILALANNNKEIATGLGL